MIFELPKFTRKSFNSYSMEEKNIKFGYVTYIYGENGRGKSSLAEEIREYNDRKGKEVRVFNRDYAKEVLTLDDSNSRLRGVKAILGQSNSRILNEIHNEWNPRKVKYETKILELKEDEKKLRERIEKSVKDIIDNSSYPGANIKRKSSKSGILNMLQSYKEEYESLSKKFKEKLEVSEKTLNNIESAKLDKYIMELRRVNIDYEYISIDWDYISGRLTTSPYNFPEPAVFLEWIKEGLNLHSSEKSEKCQFCLNTININDIYGRIQEYQGTLDLKEDLRRIKSDITNYINKYNNCLSQIRLLNSEIPGYNEEIFNNINNNSEIYNGLLSVVEAKIQDISLTEDFSKTEQTKINYFNNLLYSYVQNINDKCKNKIHELEKLQQNINDLTKMSIANKVLSSSLIDENYQKYKNVDKKLKNREELFNFTKGKIDELNKSMSEYSDFKEFLNTSLNNANFPINLDVEETDDGQAYYTLQNIQGNKLTIDSISEGEKNIISLLYFYHELLETYNKNKEPKIKDSVSAVIVDDPIASLDAANKYWIMEIVKSLIEKCKNSNECQIFILTHSWEDYINLTYGKNDNINIKKKTKSGSIVNVKDDNTIALLEVRKDKYNNSFISVLQNHNIDYPYAFIFRNIHNLSIQDDPVDSKCYMYHSPNDMRRIFETFLLHKTKDGLLAQSSNQKKIEALYKQSCKKDFQDKPGLGALLAYINIESHHVHRTVDIQKHAKGLMKYIEDIDPLHFKALIS